MDLPLHILAVVGFAAVLWRFFRAVLRAARQGVDAFIAREMAETRGQRGDLTGMSEAKDWSARAGRARRRAMAETAFWLALLVLPALLVASPAPVYAACSVLWLLPRARGERRGASTAGQP